MDALVWTPDDLPVMEMLAEFAADEISAATLASRLFEYSVDHNGPVLSEALHSAAEATTDGSADAATAEWLGLLSRLRHHGLVASSSSSAKTEERRPLLMAS
jgi:hypothetical protein